MDDAALVGTLNRSEHFEAEFAGFGHWNLILVLVGGQVRPLWLHHYEIRFTQVLLGDKFLDFHNTLSAFES